MSRFSFARCAECSRLILWGQKCVCVADRQSRCDCTYSGNAQHIGPECRRRIYEAWSRVTRSSRGEA